MNAITFNLNLNPGGAVPPKVHLSQYDNILPIIEITLYDGTTAYTIPSGATVYVAGTKADDTGFEYACSFSGSVVTVVVTEQMTAYAGIVPCELIIYVGDERKGTANFQLAVEPAALSDDTVISETDIPIIQQLPTILADVTEAGETAVNNINTAKTEALDEMEDLKEDAEAWAVGTRGGEDVPTTDETYQNNAKYYAEQAGQTATETEDLKEDAEAWAVGQRNGVDVDSTDETYQNNAKYYAGQARQAGVFYGDCATAAGTAAKEVVTTKGYFTLYAGAVVVVKFANADTAGNITINVDGTGAVSALLEGSAIAANLLNSDTAYEFVYDGTNFLLMNGGTIAANKVSYNGTDSGLSATNAQAAIDEVNDKVDDLAATDIAYDNTNSGINAMTTQAALDFLLALNLTGGAGFHNSIYRGKYLGASVTSEQFAAISAGTFDDLYIGDYWIIDGVTWRIAAFDYWLNTGDTQCTTHHVVIVPDSNLYKAKMNDSNITTGAYVGSVMYTTNLATAKSTINSAFGSSHILNHREFLTNSVSGNNANNGAWYDSTVELMNESMVYGASVNGKSADGSVNFNVEIDKSQLPLFAHDPSRITNRAHWWLRDVNSSASFANVLLNGGATVNYSSISLGVRPAFAIC